MFQCVPCRRMERDRIDLVQFRCSFEVTIIIVEKMDLLQNPVGLQLPQKSQLTIVIPSKRIQINSFDHELLGDFKLKMHNISAIQAIRIEGNSYSKQFFGEFGQHLKRATALRDLNINDIFVARKNDQIPQSIHSISECLIGSNLLRLDISNNAVNAFGAQTLLLYLQQAASLEVLLISNCGLGPLGAAQIAQGFKGTPNLRTLSIGRNRIQNQGIITVASNISFIPKLQQLYVYQNTLRTDGLTPLILQLRNHCKQLTTFDLCDNFLREQSTREMCELIKEDLNLRNLNLSDCLNEGQNQQIVAAFEATNNRQFQKLGFNYSELDSDLALRLLGVVKECPMRRLDVIGNEFKKSVKKMFSEAFPAKGILSKFEEDSDEEEVARLFEELKI